MGVEWHQRMCKEQAGTEKIYVREPTHLRERMIGDGIHSIVGLRRFLV